jgi:hypothetical protein
LTSTFVGLAGLVALKLKPTETDPLAGMEAFQEAGVIAYPPLTAAAVAFQIEEILSGVERVEFQFATGVELVLARTRLAV